MSLTDREDDPAAEPVRRKQQKHLRARLATISHNDGFNALFRKHTGLRAADLSAIEMTTSESPVLELEALQKVDFFIRKYNAGAFAPDGIDYEEPANGANGHKSTTGCPLEHEQRLPSPEAIQRASLAQPDRESDYYTKMRQKFLGLALRYQRLAKPRGSIERFKSIAKLNSADITKLAQASAKNTIFLFDAESKFNRIAEALGIFERDQGIPAPAEPITAPAILADFEPEEEPTAPPDAPDADPHAGEETFPSLTQLSPPMASATESIRLAIKEKTKVIDDARRDIDALDRALNILLGN